MPRDSVTYSSISSNLKSSDPKIKAKIASTPNNATEKISSADCKVFQRNVSPSRASSPLIRASASTCSSSSATHSTKTNLSSSVRKVEAVAGDDLRDVLSQQPLVAYSSCSPHMTRSRYGSFSHIHYDPAFSSNANRSSDFVNSKFIIPSCAESGKGNVSQRKTYSRFTDANLAGLTILLPYYIVSIITH